MAKGWTCNFNTEEEWRNQRLSTAKQLEDNVLPFSCVQRKQI